ncbi:MAG: bifunctional 5,10-methylenetetrahydrofolate dehydrogenase/5,10-methenyltetrahydrofolate cyclohydrolase [Promethearchaeota archaeon]|nr:MAG: bifunctional 5,10-methylenetetrahydrofolate dehydrogenase/5,10-methenyltetrahydrofolate cyclohydrolase [Candidatus Lokiarchaeota archaeon]
MNNQKRKILDGRKTAEELNSELKRKISELTSKSSIKPTLATILVGNDPASEVYIRIKHRTCKELGINSEMIRFKETVNANTISETIKRLNQDPQIHGILLQLPLPRGLKQNTDKLIQQIKSKKDVDGFSFLNRGQLFYKQETLAPCTPKGILKLLEVYNIDIKGKNVVIINHSNLVGKPLMLMMLNRDATVSVCHEYTKKLKSYTSNADILVVGIGNPNFITEDMIKEDAVIIDVGINRIEGKLTGDVNFEGVYEKCSKITPVPGGVGPMTVAMLMQNTIIAYKQQINSF